MSTSACLGVAGYAEEVLNPAAARRASACVAAQEYDRDQLELRIKRLRPSAKR
jgi:hypothetical protein